MWAKGDALVSYRADGIRRSIKKLEVILSAYRAAVKKDPPIDAVAPVGLHLSC